MKINYPDLKEVSKRIALFVLCVAIGWYLKGRLSPAPNMMGMGGEVYVLAQKAVNDDISAFNNKISYIEAINEVNVLPQVTGTIEKVLFKEGSLVQEGDVLFEIDPVKYQAAYERAKARLDSAKANLVKAERDYNRQVKLSNEKFASKATFDTSESAFLQAQAAVEEATANLDMAKKDLDETKVTAPITGKIGKALVTKGNYVVASNVHLAKIVQVNPMRISFSLTDKEVASLQKKDLNDKNLKMHITLATGEVISEKVVEIRCPCRIRSCEKAVGSCAGRRELHTVAVLFQKPYALFPFFTFQPGSGRDDAYAVSGTKRAATGARLRMLHCLSGLRPRIHDGHFRRHSAKKRKRRHKNSKCRHSFHISSLLSCFKMTQIQFSPKEKSR